MSELNLDRSCERCAECDCVIEQLRSQNEALRRALAGLYGLVERGELVRDISKDADPGFTMKAMELVMVLKQAQQVLSERKDSNA